MKTQYDIPKDDKDYIPPDAWAETIDYDEHSTGYVTKDIRLYLIQTAVEKLKHGNRK